MPDFLYCNGEFHPAEAPVLRAQDRGFRYGDGVFETVRVANGRPWQWEFHLRRLQSSLAAARIAAETENLADIAASLLARNGGHDCLLRIAISRGIGGRGYLPQPGVPTRVMETLPLPEPPGSLALWLSDQPAPPVRHKFAQGLAATLARLEAQDHGCGEALRLNAAGELCEATAANLFWLKNGTLHTPSLDCGVLAGATRHAVLRLSPWPVREGHFPPEAVQEAEAVFITNVALLAVPAVKFLPQGWTWPGSVDAAAQVCALFLKDMQ